MLERVALHQTRLRTPGLGLDAKGVALGTKGLILLPALDRLVALLAVHTRERSLEDLLPSLSIHLLRSKLGTREIAFEFAAESSDRMDRMAETARLVGAFTFTGTSRHFVQYRDAGAPFGYDAAQLVPADAALVLYHDKFTQSYDLEKPIDLRALLLRLMPHVDPTTHDANGPRILVAEQGLGPALLHYLVRSRVDGEVCVAEWPPESAFETSAIRRYVVRVPELPARMRRLMSTTPGITSFLPAGPGVAVEVGYRHPIALRACPLFPPEGLVLFRGRGDEPWVIERLPVFGDVRAFARVQLREVRRADVPAAQRTEAPRELRVPLRVVPTTRPWRNVTATWIPKDKLPLLRRLVYTLPRDTLAALRVAVTAAGVFLRASIGIEALPLGMFFTEIHPGLYAPAGYELSPAVAPEMVMQALAGAPSSTVFFITPSATAIALDDAWFVPLETLLLEAVPWDPVAHEALERALDETPIDLSLSSLGAFPMRDVDDVSSEPALGMAGGPRRRPPLRGA